ncbi:MAG: hypothetical protein P8Y53_11405 [Pseudolabrys sp.]|jgi:hypothetical protein
MATRTRARVTTRAPKRASARPSKTRPPSPRRYTYTPELLASGRYR